MNYIFFILVILYNCQYLIKCQVNYACNSAYCPAYGNCPKFSCKAKDLKPIYNATRCGCCHKCVKEIEEGEECQIDMTGNIPGTQCGPHMFCSSKNEEGQKDNTANRYFCVEIKDVDYNKVADYDKDVDYDKDAKDDINYPITYHGCEHVRQNFTKRMSDLTTGKPTPECDEFGDYAAKQCRNGTLCHCTNRFGKRIFGTAPYNNARDMDCLCSRQFDEVNRQLLPLNVSINPNFYLRCKSNGNYEPFQFAGDLIYCVNTTSGEVKDRPVHRKDVDQLSCRNHKYSYKANCSERYNEAMEKIKELEEEGFIVVGYDVPRCDIDGTFAPVQCQNEHCYCVNKNGEPYKGTKIERNNPDETYNEYFALNQTCNCVRELELIRAISGKDRDKTTDLFSHYKCDKNGNYLPLQCSESVCYCVSTNEGYQYDESVLKTDEEAIKNLPCIRKGTPNSYPEPYRLKRIYKNEIWFDNNN